MILFFIRTFNDVDHMVPIIYKLAQHSSRKIFVLCQNPFFEIADDYRLNFLKEKFSHVMIDYIYNSYLPTVMHRVIAFLICNRYIRKTSKEGLALLCRFKLKEFVMWCSFMVFLKFFYEWSYGRFVKKKYFAERWAERFLREMNATLLVFDHIDSKQYLTESLLKASKKIGIQTVGVPNGLPLFSDSSMINFDVYYREELKTNLDYLIVPHKVEANHRIRFGFNPEKLKIAGSARFCDEWEKILHKIVPSNQLPNHKLNGKLKVVYMERGLDRHGHYKGIIKDTLRKIGDLDFIYLIVKPHTRNNKLYYEDLPGHIDIAYDINSINLIRWSDVVMGTVSSILLEALIQDKVFIYPKFFNKDKMLFEEMGACLAVNSYDEIVTALRKIRSEPNCIPYSKENVGQFLANTVYGGLYGRDVLNDYVKLLHSLENKSI